MKIQVCMNLLMRYGIKIGLTSEEKDLLWQLLDHDFTGKNYSWPGFNRLRDRLGVESRNGLSGRIGRVEEKGLIVVSREPGKKNTYDFTLLQKALLPFWEEEVKQERKRQTETIQTGVYGEPKTIQANLDGCENGIQTNLDGVKESTVQAGLDGLVENDKNHTNGLGYSSVHYTSQVTPNSSIYPPPIFIIEKKEGGGKKNGFGEKLNSSNGFSGQSFWQMLDPVKKWWDESAVPAYQEKYKWHPGDLVTGPILAELLRHAEKFGIEVLAAKYEDFLRQDKKFFSENNHPMSLFVKCITQFSGEKNGASSGKQNGSALNYQNENDKVAVEKYRKKMAQRMQELEREKLAV